jgi:hypothetical protein
LTKYNRPKATAASAQAAMSRYVPDSVIADQFQTEQDVQPDPMQRRNLFHFVLDLAGLLDDPIEMPVRAFPAVAFEKSFVQLVAVFSLSHL